MDKHETTADVIAAMRDEAARADMEQDYSINDAAEMMREFAWRFEAAHKRESVTGSNQLREALVKARRFIDSSPLVSIVDDTGTIARGELCAEIDAAISATATAEKSSAVGDAAKLREALKLCLRGMCGYCRMDAEARGMTTECVHGCEALRKAKSALAAPARNCDKYATADEALKAQEQMFNDSNFANGECKLGCPECDNPRVGCKIAWLFAPATEKEGGNDGNE